MAIAACHFTLASAQIVDKADVTLTFDLSRSGVRYEPTWGLDQAWISEQNLRKGMNHMGKENVGIGRTAFRFTKALLNDSALASELTSVLRQRSNMFNIVSPTLPLVFTADQEAGADEYFVKNRSCDINHWAAMINSHVHWMQKNTKHPIVGVSPFNEPDYWTVEEGATVQKQWQVARLLKQEYPRMDTIAMVGGNTLNDDKALEWYTSGKQWYDWGNTHQLAGSFDNFAAFFTQLKKDGKVGYADEMHNVAEAMVGLEYGMTVGIWWGFDSRARGEFCDISRHGERLAYGEHRNNWTAASVYRHDDGRTKAFIGSSERQAYTTSYRFVSLDRDVYFDGEGPVRQWRMVLPGGTGYQKGQTNAERVVDITWCEDVPPTQITPGKYHLVNKQTGGSVAYTASGSDIVQQNYTKKAQQLWNIAPCTNRTGGDLSFLDIESANNPNIRLNVKNFATANGSIIAWTQDLPSSNEQWYLQYVGNGYYYLRNRESAQYMASAGNGMSSKVSQVTMLPEATRDRMLWRLLPADVDYETEAPAQPTGLAATALPSAVKLSWDKGQESDITGYMVLRGEVSDGASDHQWNTIARGVMPPFVDNTCKPGTSYIYKVKAVDLAQNISEASETIVASSTAERVLMAYWPLDGDVSDHSGNGRHIALAKDATWTDDAKQGEQALKTSSEQYAQLPALPPFNKQGLTVALWVNMNSTGAWQRIFDFGYDTDHYIFLTPRTTSSSSTAKLRLALKNGAEERQLDCNTGLATRQWHHVAVAIEDRKATIYLDGEVAAHTDDLGISIADINPVINYLGRSQFDSDPMLNATIDDVQMYNYALSEAEVKQILDGTTNLKLPDADEHKGQKVYSIDGRRLSESQRGVNIIDGKKVMKR
jgi:hypothetical protein